jgi:hypothetical protein
VLESAHSREFVIIHQSEPTGGREEPKPVSLKFSLGLLKLGQLRLKSLNPCEPMIGG